jgi:NADH-quinone oxidoreductase subunit I
MKNNIILSNRNNEKNGLFVGFFLILKGLAVTITFFFKSLFISTVTMEYPIKKNKIKISERFRAKLVLISGNTLSPHKCTGCKVCEKVCPHQSIYIFPHKGISNKIELRNFVWRLDACTFCNACVIACPFNALVFRNNFEQAVYDRRLLIYNLNKYIGPPKSYFKKNTFNCNLLEYLNPYEKISLKEIIGKC